MKLAAAVVSLLIAGVLFWTGVSNLRDQANAASANIQRSFRDDDAALRAQQRESDEDRNVELFEFVGAGVFLVAGIGLLGYAFNDWDTGEDSGTSGLSLFQ